MSGNGDRRAFPKIIQFQIAVRYARLSCASEFSV
jgi:hypothetical protein